MPAAESYPDDLRYHPEHDWARVDGDEATLGITWFAQDALGELVHYEAPEVGSTVTKDQPCGEVESVKAVSDVVAPLSGEVLEINQKAVDEPEIVNEDPYGDGWLIRIRMSDSSEVGLAHGSRGVPGARRRASELRLSEPDRRRPRGDARGDRRLVRRRALRAGAGRGSSRPRARRSARARRGRARSSHRGARGAERPHRRRALLPRRGDLRPLRPLGRGRRSLPRRVPDRVHAVSARDEPGRAAGGLRVPDADLRADRDGRVQRVRVRRHDRRRRCLLRREARRSRSQEDRPRARRSTRRCARS